MAEVIRISGDAQFDWSQVEKFFFSHGDDPVKSASAILKFKPVWIYIHERQKKIACQVIIDCFKGPGLSDYQADIIRKGVYTAFREIQSDFDLILNEILVLLFESYLQIENL